MEVVTGWGDSSQIVLLDFVPIECKGSRLGALPGSRGEAEFIFRLVRSQPTLHIPLTCGLSLNI